MSRIGRRPVPIPEGVSVERTADGVVVTGPRGRLEQRLPAEISVEIADGQVRLSRSDDRRRSRALHGLARALVANLVRGVTEGFRKQLEIEGVGYRAEMRGKDCLVLTVGYSHPVEMKVPEGLTVSVEGNNRITVEGASREAVGQFAANIRAVRPPEPYKGKGIRYAGETIRRKVGKAGAA